MQAKYWRYSVATAAAVILLTACQADDPVALTPEHPSPLDEDLLMETAAFSGGSSSGTMIDNTRPRFKIEVSTSNALTPGASITVNLQGEAVEKIASGTVTVRLPTMASMDYAGADKRPYYPAGQSLPVVRKWTLPAMNPGNTWNQWFSISLPSEKGYYDLLVDADVAAPEDAHVNPFVDDELQYERWMLVTDADGGGSMTGLGFDKSVFADDIAPVPGPFRIRSSNRATTGQTASAGVGMNSDNEVTLSLKYPGTSGQGMIAAVGVEVRANMYNGQGQHIASYSRVVGTNSRVSFVCPTGSQYMEGSAILPSTVDIHQGTFVSFWDADSDDCGETFNVIGPRHFYMPWKRLKEVTSPTRNHFGISTFAKVYWTTNLSETRSSYDPDTHTITFGAQSYANKWTAAHEYAHAMHEKRLNGLWSVEQPACQNHDTWEASGYRCALLEGFADYAASIGSGWPPNFENPPSNAEHGPDVEGRVAAMFHDLIDSANGSGDATTYSGSSIGTAFKTCERRTGGGSWHRRSDVSEFVWCLENRINTSVHSDYFTTAAPSAQRATRGSGWNADNIRTTWTHNLSS